MKKNRPLIFCVIPNYNGADFLSESVQSVLDQTVFSQILIVDNASTDGSIEHIEKEFGSEVAVLKNNTNRGFAGGVNDGINYALKHSAEFVALFNNDAKADKNWLDGLVKPMIDDNSIGIVTGKFLYYDGCKIDSAGDFYSNWLLAFPRGRGEAAGGAYKNSEYVFGATGGASLYRADMLRQIGLFDEDFFAYYEDVDISFRAQTAGWKVFYNPNSLAYHRIGSTSSRMPGFAAYHTVKNVPLVWIKNLPLGLWWPAVPKFYFAYYLMLLNMARKGNLWPATKGTLALWVLLPKKIVERHRIMKAKKVTNRYIRSILYPDLPPDRHKLRKLRALLLLRKAKT